MVLNAIEKSPKLKLGYVSFACRKEQQEQLLWLALPGSNL